jgi:protein gp37
MTDIQWTHQDGYKGETWNPIAAFNIETGKRGWMCSKPSAGCKNCYAEELNRFRGNGLSYAAKSLDQVRYELVNIDQPLHWRMPRAVFVCSMTDLLHERHSDEMIARIFATMAIARRHIFLVLTKRAGRMRDLLNDPDFAVEMCKRIQEIQGSPDIAWLQWPLPNVRLGVTCENQATADERIPLLLQTPAAIRFLSCEPLLGPIEFGRRHQFCPEHDFPGGRCTEWHEGVRTVDWVIVGGESGRDARLLDLDWMYDIVAQCDFAGTPVFVKQLGRRPVRREKGAVVWPIFDLVDKHGGDMAEWPEDLRIRQFPAHRNTTDADTSVGSDCVVLPVGGDSETGGKVIDLMEALKKSLAATAAREA